MKKKMHNFIVAYYYEDNEHKILGNQTFTSDDELTVKNIDFIRNSIQSAYDLPGTPAILSIYQLKDDEEDTEDEVTKEDVN